MASLETKIADNYIVDSTFMSGEGDSQKTPFLRKNLTFVTDSQNGGGNYSSGQITYDGTSLAAVGGNSVQDWANAYLVIPYNINVTCLAAEAPGDLTFTSGAQYLAALKNNSLLDSITVEHMGKTIINRTPNISHITNFKVHATTSQDDLNKGAASRLYYPDSVGNSSSTKDKQGTKNNSNDSTQKANLDSKEFYNSGLLKRQQMLIGSIETNFNTSARLKTEGDVFQAISALSSTITTGALTFDLHFNCIIYLSDYSDYFAKHPISRGAGYKIYCTVNQAVTTVSTAAVAKPFAAVPLAAAISNTVLTSGSVQPAMLCVGPGTLCAGFTCSNNVVHTLKLTSQIDYNNANARPNGLRMYVPGYECAPETIERITKQPIIKRQFMDIFSTVIQHQVPDGFVNQQIAGAISRPRAIVVIPQYSQTSQGQGSQLSAFNPSPGTTDPQLSLTQIQIKVGSNYILPDRLNYSFSAFLENTSQMFGIDAGLNRQVSAGVIDAQKFRNNYRYYAFDISRYPDAVGSTPQLISLECFNNSDVNVDLYVYVLYGRDCSVNILNGSIEVE
tara:strand:+ start:25 stop:1707 length:1683 start_codon:yes stop_codon:yes gene_type:complete